MNLCNSKIYIEDLKNAMESTVKFERLHNKSVMITGAAGLIGSFIADVLMYANRNNNANIRIYALGRNKERLENRFPQYINDKNFICVEHDVNKDIDFDFEVQYIIHAASNAYPAAFNSDPVGTIMSNVIGTQKLLQYGKKIGASRLMFISSGEVYGEGDIAVDAFVENYSGYVDPTQPRSCYPISKRAAETLCSSYTKQFGLDTIIVRPCHSYGPNATSVDNRANVQFVNNVLSGEDIILKSSGNQMRSYCYVADCASGILTVLLNGKGSEAYNIANRNARTTIAGYAKVVAELAGKKVVFENPHELEEAEQTPVVKQVLDSLKLESLGWKGRYSVKSGISNTLKILMDT